MAHQITLPYRDRLHPRAQRRARPDVLDQGWFSRRVAMLAGFTALWLAVLGTSVAMSGRLAGIW
jgi:hypothetical protein